MTLYDLSYIICEPLKGIFDSCLNENTHKAQGLPWSGRPDILGLCWDS